jgi:hypothetical protein
MALGLELVGWWIEVEREVWRKGISLPFVSYLINESTSINYAKAVSQEREERHVNCSFLW